MSFSCGSFGLGFAVGAIEGNPGEQDRFRRRPARNTF